MFLVVVFIFFVYLYQLYLCYAYSQIFSLLPPDDDDGGDDDDDGESNIYAYSHTFSPPSWPTRPTIVSPRRYLKLIKRSWSES